MGDGVGVRVTSEGPGLALPGSLSGFTGDTSGDNIDWEDGGLPPGSIATGNFEKWNEGGDPLLAAHGNFGATETIDPTLGNVHTGTLDDDCTVTLDPPSGTSATLRLRLTQDGTGGRDITWAGSVDEIGTPDTSAGTTNLAVALTDDGGTTWIVVWVGSGGGGGSGSITASGYTMTTARLLGRTTASTGAIEEITVGSGLSLSAGALTATGGSGVASGTSFPGSPSTGDLFWRTDRAILYFYNGTRWLGTDLKAMYLGQSNGNSATATVEAPLAAFEVTYDLWMETFYASMYVGGSLGAGAYWTVGLDKYDGASVTTIASVNDQSGTNAVYERKSAAINALLGTSMDGMEVTFTKTGAPQPLFASAFVTYRLVG